VYRYYWLHSNYYYHYSLVEIWQTTFLKIHLKKTNFKIYLILLITIITITTFMICFLILNIYIWCKYIETNSNIKNIWFTPPVLLNLSPFFFACKWKIWPEMEEVENHKITHFNCVCIMYLNWNKMKTKELYINFNLTKSGNMSIILWENVFKNYLYTFFLIYPSATQI